MLAACSNPSSVMRQQLAFEQQESKAAGRAGGRLLLGSRSASSSRDNVAARGQKHAVSKPRKGWMALF
jgi:hypothetical protein